MTADGHEGELRIDMDKNEVHVQVTTHIACLQAITVLDVIV